MKTFRLIILSLANSGGRLPLRVDDTDKTLWCLLAKTAVLTVSFIHGPRARRHKIPHIGFRKGCGSFGCGVDLVPARR